MRPLHSSRLLPTGLLLGVLLLATRAHAEEPPSTTTSAIESVAVPNADGSATPARDDLDRARALLLFEEAKERYRTGRFRESAVRLKEAWALAKEPVLLYNLARSCENAGYLMCAEETYAAYVALDAKAEDLPAIKIRLEVLRGQIREREDDERPAIAPWIIAGTGVLGLGVGTTLGIVATERHAEGDAELIQVRAIELQEQATDLATASTVTFVTSGVVTGVGLVWGALDLATLGIARDGLVDIALGPLSADATFRF